MLQTIIRMHLAVSRSSADSVFLRKIRGGWLGGEDLGWLRRRLWYLREARPEVPARGSAMTDATDSTMGRRAWRAMMPPHFLLLLLLVPGGLLGACGDDSGGGRDGGLDGALRDGGGDAGGDAAADAQVTTSPCLTPLVTDTPFALDPDGPDTQIHAAAAFDGESIWVVYNRPDALGGFDVYGVRLQCDTTWRLPPFQINTTDHNDVDPTLAVGNGHLYVAWQTDTGTGVDNMQLLLRTFDVGGVPLMSADEMLRTTRAGQPVPGNTWMPALAPLPTGFAVAGARAVPDASGFQVFLQRLDDQGAAVEPTLDASFAPASSQTYPALAAAPDGALLLAYLQADPPDFTDRAVLTRFAAGASTPAPLPPIPAAGRDAGDAAAVALGPGGETYVAFSDPDAGQVVLAEAASNGAEAVLGEAGRSFSPALAAAPGGGAVAYYQNVSGIQNQLWALRFTHSTWGFQLGSPVQVTLEMVAPYPPTIAHVTQDVYFLAWSQGDSPDFRLMGAFVRLPTP